MVVAGIGWRVSIASRDRGPLVFSLSHATILADGQDQALLSIRAQPRPSVSFDGNSRGAVIEGVEGGPGNWRAVVRGGILPGSITLRIQAPEYRTITTRLTLTPDYRDSVGDGTPDFLRLNDLRDQEAFRDWFVWLAEAQYFLPPEARPTPIDDCAALIRFAYREALATHDSAWANTILMPELPLKGFSVDPGGKRARVSNGELFAAATRPVFKSSSTAQPRAESIIRSKGRTTLPAAPIADPNKTEIARRRFIVRRTILSPSDSHEIRLGPGL